MMFLRLGRLPAPVLCFAVVLFGVGVPNAAAQNQQQQQQQQQPKPPNPFETVPTAPAEPKPAQPTPAPAPPPPPAAAQTPAPVARPGQPPQNIIEAIEFRGARRVRQDTLQALIFSKKGDQFDPEALHRDFMALWNS